MTLTKPFNLIRELTILFGICLAAELIANIMPFTMPANILGMVLLFVLLCTKVIKTEHINATSDFLLHNMAFFFIASGISLMDSFVLIKDTVLIFLFICLFSTVVTFAATAYTVTLVTHIQKCLLAKKAIKTLKEAHHD
ncbi:MAG: CidA/LrgA family protein [Clostridia bacterium]|jgi:holin-like protein|nr:CidA/LrgA family protein [Clostridia bacterium]